MEAYSGKQMFTIHANDAGQEAYRHEYVEWLKLQLAAADDLIAHLRGERDLARRAATNMARVFIAGAEPGERMP